MKELNITTATNNGELIIRQGNAPDEKHAPDINYEGVLSAPADWLAGKTNHNDYDPLTSHIAIRKDEGIIALVVGESDPHTKIEIVGKLRKNSALKVFQINTEKRWLIREFLAFIKMNRFHFEDKAAHSAIVQSIQKWSVKIERVINEHNDNKGNSNFQLETKVQAVEGLVTKFDLLIPIYQGYDKKKFTVEIGLDPRNTEVHIYLFSDELAELEILVREQLIRDELARFEGYPCSKIVLS